MIDIKDFIKREFEYLHQNPELSYQEFNTTQRIKDDLLRHGIKILDTNLKTGLVAEIGQGPRTIALRADIDALPVVENTDLPYKSQNDGVMHACGHDSHAATLIGTALLLKEQENLLKGKVKLVFQPAEEAPGGAKLVLDSGALDEVEAIFGIHSSSLYEVGTLGLKAGATHAAVDRFKIEFEGKGTHAAHPDEGIDTLVVATNFVNAAQTLISRESAPYATNVLSITHLEAGNTWNVVPQTALIEGTIRTYTKDNRVKLKTRLEQLAQGIANSFGAKAKVSFLVELPATNNDEMLYEFSKQIALDSGLNVEPAPQSLGGEDFALYQEQLKGNFILFGTGQSAPNHNPNFKINVDALYPTAKYLSKLAIAYLEKTNAK